MTLVPAIADTPATGATAGRAEETLRPAKPVEVVQTRLICTEPRPELTRRARVVHATTRPVLTRHSSTLVRSDEYPLAALWKILHNAHHLRELQKICEDTPELGWAKQMADFLVGTHRQVQVAKARGHTGLGKEALEALWRGYGEILTKGDVQSRPGPGPPENRWPHRANRATSTSEQVGPAPRRRAALRHKLRRPLR